MGIMLQDTFLFSTTIKENIRYGKLNATDEGCISEVGSHYELMNLKGLYYKIYISQYKFLKEGA